MYSRESRGGFTLIELLLVISIIGLLSSVTLAAVNTARELARLATAKQSDTSIYRANSLELLGEWKMDDVSPNCSGAVSSVLDTSGSGLHLNPDDSPTWSSEVPYERGCSLKLDSVSAVTISNDITLAQPTMSGFAWIRPDSSYLSSRQNIFLCRDGGWVDGWTYCLDAKNNTIQIRFTTIDDGSITLQAPAGTLDIERWNFVGFSYDGTQMHLYKDGAQVASMSATGGLDPGPLPPNIPFVFYIGYPYSDSINPSFSGEVDLVRLYDKPLNASEVRALYALGLQRFGREDR